MAGSLLLRCTLVGSETPAWRRVRMPGRFPLGRLHKALQVLFGWLDYHLHEFEIEGVAYTQAELREDLWEDHLDEAGFRLSELPDRSFYRYDMGDNWEVEVVVEERSREDSLWATAPLRSDELGRLPTEWRREERVLAVLDTLADGVSVADLQAAVAEHGKKFQVNPVLALMPVTLGAGGLVMYRQHPMIQNLRLRLRRKQAFWGGRRDRVKAELPEAGWLLAWDADTIWSRSLAGGPDQTLRGAERRDLLESVQVVYAPQVLRLYEGLGIEARREVYRYDLMPLELFDGMRQYPAGSRFEDFLESTVGKTGLLLDRLEAYWRHGCEQGEVLLRRTEVHAWWNFTSDSYDRLRRPLLGVEF